MDSKLEENNTNYRQDNRTRDANVRNTYNILFQSYSSCFSHYHHKWAQLPVQVHNQR